MDITAQQKTILELMPATSSVGSNVSCFKRWQGFLASYRALTCIDVGNHDPERTLAKPRSNDLRLSVAIFMRPLVNLTLPA